MTPDDFEKELVTIANKMVTLAEESPDFVYVGDCQYAPNTKNPQGCLVGAAVRGTKLSLDKHPEQTVSVSNVLRSKARVNYFDLSSSGVELLEEMRNVQRKQDRSTPWGKAVHGLKILLEKRGQLDG